MAVSPYFNNAYNTNEQNLMEDLAIESIMQRGNDLAYLPRTNVDKDSLMEEDTQVAFNGHFMIEALTRSVESFQGDGHFMSQLGVEIRDQIVYDMSIKRFVQEANTAGFNLVRPREGDLVFDAVTDKILEIKFCDKYVTNFPLGKIVFWSMRCEQFEYAGQQLNTGIPEIDSLTGELSQDILPLIVKDTNGDPVLDPTTGEIQWLSSDHGNFEPNDDTTEVRKEAREIINWDQTDPFSESSNF